MNTVGFMVASCVAVLLLTTSFGRAVHLVRAKADTWHRPGCHKIGHTRTIEIPDCVQFTISTNACRGFCESFAVPSAPVGDAGAGNALGNHPNAVGEAGLGGGGGGGGGVGVGLAEFTPHYNALSGGGSGNGYGGAEHPHVTRRRPPANKPVTSVGQCCNIMESEDVPVRVNCVDGPRNLTFKSATKCACYHCKKD